MKKYPTEYQKRKLIYEKKLKEQQIQFHKNHTHPLDLPIQFKNKISLPQYKKLKQAFYIQSTTDVQQEIYTLNREQFVDLIRSLGIVSKTVPLYQQFDQYRSKTINWENFLKIYLNLRAQKGSYNELNDALSQLQKQYRGDWQFLQEDLMNIGDTLSAQQMQIFAKQIIGNQPLTKQVLLNSLLGYSK